MECHKVVHMSSVHPLFDVRIFHKECKTLDNEKYDVVLVGTGSAEEQPSSDTEDGIKICIVPRSTHRFYRMTFTVIRVLIAAIASRGKVYHFHAPELIPAGIILKLFRNKVIYDAHEDLPLQVLSKDWIPFHFRRSVAMLLKYILKFSTILFDGIVAATPSIAAKFPPHKTVTVQNFPISTEFRVRDWHPYRNRPPKLVYIGGITAARGSNEMILGIGMLPEVLQVRLVLAGMIEPLELEKQLMRLPGWNCVDFLGWQSRAEVGRLLGTARVGLVLFQPLPNHIEAQPNKLFEYMSAGLPVIASNFPLWKKLIEEIGCGLTVNPMDPNAIADAIHWLIEHPAEAERMGRAGQQAIRTKYNWEIEGGKLLEFYNGLLN